MALRSLLRNLPALGLRSLAVPPVQVPLTAAAACRHMSSQAWTIEGGFSLMSAGSEEGYVYPKLVELDQLIAENRKAHTDLDKWDKGSKALCYPINAFSVFTVLSHPF